MRFLLDMGVSPATARHLQAQGHDAVHLADEGLFALTDADIILKARREGRVVLTVDLDFADLMAHSSASQPSVIIFRLADQTPRSINGALDRCLPQLEETLLQGAIVSVTEKRVRVRPLPIHPLALSGN